MECLSLLVERFRYAIDVAHADGQFDWEYEPFHKDRMENFPYGCCDDVCDLLFHYFLTEHNLVLQQINAFYVEGNTYHNWLVSQDGLIIDLTGDQFNGRQIMCAEPDDGFYSRMTNRKEVSSFCVFNCNRLERDYKVIMKYLKFK